MTNQEAIEILKKDGWGYPENMHTEAVMMAIDALEKQIPLEPVEMDVEQYALGEITTGQCPKCRFPVDVLRRYCPNCGQRLDWSEVEE